MHRFIPDPSEDPRAEGAINATHAAAIRRWTSKVMKLVDTNTTITVNDTPCIDAGWPLVETVITAFGEKETRAWTFTRPSVAVTKMMIQQTLASVPRVTKAR